MSFQLKPSPEEEAKTAMVGLTTFFDNMFTYDSAWKSANGIEAMRVIMKRADADLTKAKGPAEKIESWIPTTTEDKAKKIRIKDKFGSCCMTIAGMKAQIAKKAESKQRRREKRERATPVPSLIQTTFSVPAGTGKEPKEEVQLFFQESPPSPQREERVADPTVSVVLESPPESPSIDKEISRWKRWIAPSSQWMTR